MTQEESDRLSILLADADKALREAYLILWENRVTDTGWSVIAEAGDAVSTVANAHGFSVRV